MRLLLLLPRMTEPPAFAVSCVFRAFGNDAAANSGGGGGIGDADVKAEEVTDDETVHPLRVVLMLVDLRTEGDFTAPCVLVDDGGGCGGGGKGRDRVPVLDVARGTPLLLLFV